MFLWSLYLATVSSEVILAVEKRITSPLMEPTSIGMLPPQHWVLTANLHYFSYFHSLEKIVEIDSHIACAFSGLTADSKTLIDRFYLHIFCFFFQPLLLSRARVESQNHWFTYDEKMQVKAFNKIETLLNFWCC